MEKEKVFTREYFVKMGKKGGLKTKKKYGSNHYSKINPKKKQKELIESA